MVFLSSQGFSLLAFSLLGSFSLSGIWAAAAAAAAAFSMYLAAGKPFQFSLLP